MLLTSTTGNANLYASLMLSVNPLMTIMGRFQARKNNGVGDYTQCRSLFLCPKSHLSTLKNLSLWWRRLLEQLRYAALETNMNFHRPKSQAFSGGLFQNNGASHMHSHAKNFNKTNTPILPVRLKSLFLLLNADKQLIASGLGFEQIKPLADTIRGSVIKFQKFEKIGVFA